MASSKTCEKCAIESECKSARVKTCGNCCNYEGLKCKLNGRRMNQALKGCAIHNKNLDHLLTDRYKREARALAIEGIKGAI